MNKTTIGWTDFSWNPTTGCWGPGGTREEPRRCGYCYATRIARRFGRDEASRSFIPRLHPDRLDEPMRVARPGRIFVCSMGDLLGPWVPSDFIDEVIETIRACSQHDFQILTKNPLRYGEFEWPENAWLGATATTQHEYARAIGPLSLARGGGPKFISAEPIAGEVAIGAWAPNWVIIGPETGPAAPQPPTGSIHALTMQCIKRGIPIFHKRGCGYAYPRREFPQRRP